MITVTLRLCQKNRPARHIEVVCAEINGTENIGAPIGAKSAPTKILDYSVLGSAQGAPTPRLIGARSAQTSPKTRPIQSSPNGPALALQEWLEHGLKRRVEKPLAEDLAEAVQVLKELTNELDAIDDELRPSRDREAQIKAGIQLTHHKHGNVICLNLDGASVAKRKQLFAELDEITETWGPLRADRKRTHTEIKLLGKHVERLRSMIERKAKKRGKGHG